MGSVEVRAGGEVIERSSDVRWPRSRRVDLHRFHYAAGPDRALREWRGEPLDGLTGEWVTGMRLGAASATDRDAHLRGQAHHDRPDGVQLHL